VRTVHWLFVALFALSWWSAEHKHLDYHRYSGCALLGLLLFRLYWGAVGTRTARFATFVKGPRAIWHHVRGASSPVQPGHTPLGALSVLALLSLLMLQIGLGLFSVDVDGLESGRLARLISFETGRTCAHFHHVVFNVLLGFALLHVAAILFYLLRGRDLITPMISGRASWTESPVRDISSQVPWWRAALGASLAALVAGYLAAHS
jgi:cytochrome b